jgi:hypothetical protein
MFEEVPVLLPMQGRGMLCDLILKKGEVVDEGVAPPYGADISSYFVELL